MSKVPSVFKPMLAAKSVNMDLLIYPVIGSPKLDGVRAVVIDGVVYSRNLKPIPNRLVQRMFGHRKYNGLDGELMVGEPTADDVFRVTTSYVMSEHAELLTKNPCDIVRFYVFDDFSNPNEAYKLRFERARNKARHTTNVVPVANRVINSKADIDDFEDWCLAMGFEGVMLRVPQGPYKFGRSTEREAYLVKVKRFEDSEARITDAVEKETNTNEAKRDELGRSKRSTHKAGKVGAGTLGAIEVTDVHTGVAFAIGSGFNDAQRAALWADHAKGRLVGRLVRYSYFPTGSKDKPRFPVFQGFRDPADM